MISLISCTWPLKMRSEISGELSRISTAATRPTPPFFGIRRCEMKALRLSDRSISSWARRSSGKKLMMRSSAWLALLACSVDRHRWPVSANEIAYSMVSRSRISPMRMTSGAWRSVFFSAANQLSVSMPTSRWLMIDFLCSCTYSIGSSIVMMWSAAFSLRWPTMAASEVDLPEPVAPTKTTRPRLIIATSRSTGGRLRLSIFGILVLIVRITTPTRPCCTNTLTRKRPISGGLMAKLDSLVASKSRHCRSFMIERASSLVWPGVRLWLDTGVIFPSTLIAGGKPAVMKRSDAFFASIRRSRSWTVFSAFICRSSTQEGVFVLRRVARDGRRNDVALDQVLQVLVERLHADVAAGLDRRVHLRDLAFADQVADRGGADHDLVRGDAAGAVLGLQQRLRDHRAQRFRQHRAHHLLLGRREHVDHAVDGLGGGRGVQGAEHQVAGFGGGQREADGFQVAQFADQDDVGVFPQRAAQGVGERQRVRADLALVDQALLALVHEFDRVLDGEDVRVLVLVDVVHHRCQRGRLARAGRPGDEHDAARLVRDLLEDGRAVELLQRQHLGRNRAEHRACAILLVEGVDAEACQRGDLEREVDFQRLLVHLALAVVHDVVHHSVHVLVLERRQVDAADVAADADHRRQAGRKVQVRRLVFDGKCQQLRNVHACLVQYWVGF